MLRTRTIGEVEADLLALRAAAERAGMALACLFSSSDEFEAAVIRARREQGAFRPRRRTAHAIRSAALTGVLTFVFLMM